MASFLEKYEEARAHTNGDFLPDTLGIRVIDANAQQAVLQMAFKPSFATLIGTGLHGGALMALADHAAAVACAYAVDPGWERGVPPVVTVQFNAHLLRNAGQGTLTAVAQVVHHGRTMLAAEIRVQDEQNRTLLLATSTHVVVTLGGG
jgi:1,4-dihydroxy-2-naphthoyl-CoA hydrolase